MQNMNVFENTTVNITLILSRSANSSIWPLDGTLSGATILTQCKPGSNGNEGLLHIP